MNQKLMRGLVVSSVAVLSALSSGLQAGCAGEGEAPLSGPAIPIEATAASDASVALRIERAARALDRGEDAKKASAELRATLADPASTRPERDEATLVLSRALEAAGDKEGAIGVIEALLAEHAADSEWPSSGAAERRLRKLLTGKEGSPRRPITPGEPQVSSFARALTKFFPADEGGRHRVQVLTFGGDHGHASERLGTFNVEGALREAKEKNCPSCEPHIGGMVRRFASWIGIVQSRAEVGSSLVVYYYDLEGGEIPGRYDAVLPLPSAEIQARLAKGKGLVAAREREGAPPVILVAAPRFAQLDDVEATLAGMDELPKEPRSVDVPASLEAEEIKAVVRASFDAFKLCYEAVLAVTPTAAGTVALDFKVELDGRVSGAKAKANSAELQPMEACMREATDKLAFPAATKETTVVYPIQFSP